MTHANMSRSAALCLVGLVLTACAVPEHEERFFLGEATRANIAIHAERAPNVPNTAEVNGEQGDRAAEAVRRLRDKPAGG